MLEISLSELMVKTIVVIPAMNEEKHIGNVVSQVKKKIKNVIVIDDGSTDKTSKISKKAGAEVITLPKNMGKGFAMRLGAIEAMNKKADIIVFMDGDGQHRAEDISKFVNKIKKGADIVFGGRDGGIMPPIKKLGNWGIGLMFRILFGTEPNDLLCGFKAINRKILPEILWKSEGYSVEIEIAVRVAKKKIKTETVQIPSIYHDPKKGTTVWDGLKLGKEMLRMKFMTMFEGGWNN